MNKYDKLKRYWEIKKKRNVNDFAKELYKSTNKYDLIKNNPELFTNFGERSLDLIITKNDNNNIKCESLNIDNCETKDIKQDELNCENNLSLNNNECENKDSFDNYINKAKVHETELETNLVNEIDTYITNIVENMLNTKLNTIIDDKLSVLTTKLKYKIKKSADKCLNNCLNKIQSLNNIDFVEILNNESVQNKLLDILESKLSNNNNNNDIDLITN